LFVYLFVCFLNPVTAIHPPVSGQGSQCLSGKGEDYRGRIAITESGNACQHWNTQFPHRHGWIPDRYPCKYAEPCRFNKCQRTSLFLIDADAEARVARVFCSYVDKLFSHLLSALITSVQVLFLNFFSIPFFTNCFILRYLSHPSPPHPTAEL